MSKTTTAPQTIATTPATQEKKVKKPLFGLSQDELKMVVGGGIVIGSGQVKFP